MSAFLVSCGGTGGHVFPGLATAAVLRKRGHDVTVCFSGKAIENATRSAWDGPAITIQAATYGMSPLGLVRTFRSLWRAYRTARSRLVLMRPAAVLAMGSSSSVGPVLAAHRLGIPVVLHEANAIPGRAVEFLSRFADATAVSFPATQTGGIRSRVVSTGLPLRQELEQACHLPRASADCPTLLVMGGSQGARSLNTVVPESLVRLHREGLRMKVVHLAGERDKSAVEAIYAAAGIPHSVAAFQRDMAAAYREASLAIARSGASSCAELMLFAVPSVLIPYPHAARNHQVANARSVAGAGGALVVEEAGLTAESLATVLRPLCVEPLRLSHMGDAIRQASVSGAADRLADLVERVAASR